MDGQKFGELINKIKDFVSKNLKVTIIIAIVVICSLVGFKWYNSQPKSIVSELKTTFSGYDGYGTLNFNSEDIQKKVWGYSLKEVGFKKDEIDGVINQDEIVLSEIHADPQKASKLQQATTIVGTVSYKFNKYSKLKNGETIVFTVKNTSTKSPIKTESKKIKVKGLDKTEKISLKKLQEAYPIEILGFEGFGYLNIPKDSEGSPIYLLKDKNLNEYDANFKNGEKVNIIVSGSYIDKLKSEGKKLDKESFDFEISGLQPIVEVKGIESLISKNDDKVKSIHENTDSTSYQIEKQKSYISFVPENNNEFAKGTVNLVTVYKITQNSKYVDPRVYYYCVGYNYNVENNEQLASKDNYEVDLGQTSDEENLLANLKTDNYTELK
ncbi:hypothetical protein [Streptococcus uberis]|uniref:hypothetical protein n=1 Tax=Streptococcus uberis TaxID=1349 RepID=UPI0037B38CE0